MAQEILTDELVVLYDPVETIFDVFAIGGQVTQQQNLITGEFEPDRTQTPLQLKPSLLVTDPNTGEVGVEKIGNCSVQWSVIDGQGNATTITEDGFDEDDPYYRISESLIVQTNINAGQVQKLHVLVTWPDPYAGQKTYERDIALSTSALVDFAPQVTVDAPVLLTANPLRFADEGTERTVTASFFAGPNDLSTNANIVYLWEKKDGVAYRAITDTDVDVKSIATRSVNINGTATTVHYRTMVLNLKCIKNEVYRCTAYHASYPEMTSQVIFGVDRKMYGARVGMEVTKGKFLKPDVTESTAEVSVFERSNKIGEASGDTRDPLDFYRFEWNFKVYNGATCESTTALGWGKTATADRSLSGTSKTKTPKFCMQAHELSEHRLLKYGNYDYLTYNGNPVVGQVLID